MARNKVEHLEAKEEKINFGDKEFTIEPMRNRELFDFAEFIEDKWDELMDKDPELNLEGIIKLVRKEPVPIINEVVKEEFTEDDFLDAYPNDIYNLVQVFKEINFTFLQKLASPLQRIAQFLGQSPEELQEKLQNQ